MKYRIHWVNGTTTIIGDDKTRTIDEAFNKAGYVKKSDVLSVNWYEPIYEEETKCTCGNPTYGFDCVCDHIKTHHGNTTYCCEFCGVYEASEPRCSKCEEMY